MSRVTVSELATHSVGGEAHSHMVPMGALAAKFNAKSRELNNGRTTKVVRRETEQTKFMKVLL